MDTREYRTRTIFQGADNSKLKSKVWPVGLDIGYSAVKIFSGNAIACFPSYAEPSRSSLQVSLGGEGNDDEYMIQYRGEDNVIWNVGASAQDSISASDTTAGSLAIFGRNRYYDPMFKVLARTGIAAGIRKSKYGDPTGKRIMVQTGLPPKYVQGDSWMLTDILKGKHEFQVRFGSQNWETFSFELTEDDIAIIDQPMGTLFSVSMDSKMNMLPGADKFFTSRVLIMDAGFGTFDTFPIIRHSISRDDCQTFDGLGMKQVLKDTADEIFHRYHFEVSVPAMQQYLKTGKVIKREGMSFKKVGFDDILERRSRMVCTKAIDKIMEIYNPPLEYDYLILTGGTGAAWDTYVRESEYFKDTDTVTIVSGNQGDPSLPYIFSNVRGYYILMVAKLLAQEA